MAKKVLLPMFRAVLWSYDFDKVDVDKDRRRIIVNTINYGEWCHWLWIIENYGKAMIKEIIEATPATEFRPQALKLASIIFSAGKPKYASRSSYIRR